MIWPEPIRTVIWPEPIIESEWTRKQAAARPGRYYGGSGTIHQTGHLDIETYDGKVISVWFRCQQVPFRQTEVDDARAETMLRARPGCRLTGLEIMDTGAI